MATSGHRTDDNDDYLLYFIKLFSNNVLTYWYQSKLVYSTIMSWLDWYQPKLVYSTMEYYLEKTLAWNLFTGLIVASPKFSKSFFSVRVTSKAYAKNVAYFLPASALGSINKIMPILTYFWIYATMANVNRITWSFLMKLLKTSFLECHAQWSNHVFLQFMTDFAEEFLQ